MPEPPHPSSVARVRVRVPWHGAALWLAVYLAVVAVPLFALLPGGAAEGSGWGWDFAMALGYAAVGMLGVQFALTARFRRATAPFGIDLVYWFHRYLALCALTVVAGHYAMVRWTNAAALGPADPRAAPAFMTAGRLAALLFALLVALSLARRRLGVRYEVWRTTHLALAVTAFGLTLWHLHGAGTYLDTPWKRALWWAYGAFWLALVVFVRLVRPWLLARRPWRVAAVRPELGRVCTLVLEPPPGEPLVFAPGQFGWLTLRTSPFAMHEHPFSIASSAERRDRVELSIKALGDFSASVESVRPGETVWFDAPYGTFGVDEHRQAPGYVFVAGGIGIAPILSMLRTLADRGDRRPLVLFYGNRVWQRVAFRDELEALSARLDLRVVHVLLEPAADWQGERGFVAQDVLQRHLPAGSVDWEYFLCGPTAMTRSVEHGLHALGTPAARVHSEIFEWV